MSQAGVFKIILRDDRFEESLKATEFLRERLKKIRNERTKEKKDNPSPTWEDITRDHVMFVGAIYKPFVSIAGEYTKIKPSGDGTSFLTQKNGSIQFVFPTYGHFTSDMVIHLKLPAVGTLKPSTNSPYYRYCAYPGLRIFKKVAFKSDQTLVDDYTRDEAVMFSKFFIPDNGYPGWSRGMGQQQIQQSSVINPAGYTNINLFANGLQTPAQYQPPTDLWIPLQFDFCRDAAHALPNDLITNTQRIVEVELATVSEIIQATDSMGNLVSASNPSSLAIDISLYVNSLFVNPEIHEIIASRVGFSLIRVHRRQISQTTLASQSIVLEQMKYPIEFILFGFRDINNLADFDLWWLMGTNVPLTTNQTIYTPIAYWNPSLLVVQFAIRAAKNVTNLGPVIDSLSVSAQGIDLYKTLPLSFYSNYLPNRYMTNAQASIYSPIDPNVGLISECLYPGQYQPSGYYSASANRELQLTYKSSWISSANTAEYVVMGSALNFLIRNGDRVALRFST